MKIVTKDIFPPEISRGGKNTYIIPCDDLNRRANYGACLFTIDVLSKGKLDKDHPCYSPINHGTCEALKYQAQEQAAGRALFYSPRIPLAVHGETTHPPYTSKKPRKPDEKGYMRGWNMVGGSNCKSVSKVKKSSITNTVIPTLADAINVAVTDDIKSKKPSMAGLSLLERARLMR